MKFKVKYIVKKIEKERTIDATWEDVEKKANKVSKKWYEVILINKKKGKQCY